MKKIAFAVALMLALAGFSACDNFFTSRTLDRFSRQVIVFPDSLELLFDGMALSRNLNRGSAPYKQVILVDSLECSFCRVQKLQRYRDLVIESIEEGKFDLVVIVCPKREEAGLLRQFLLAHEISIPIYLDPDCRFIALNPGIPSSQRFHMFLLDASGHPVYVGDPLKGNRSYEQFERIINQ